MRTPYETYDLVKRLHNQFLGYTLLQVEIALGDEAQAQRLDSLKRSLKDRAGAMMRELKQELEHDQ